MSWIEKISWKNGSRGQHKTTFECYKWEFKHEQRKSLLLQAWKCWRAAKTSISTLSTKSGCSRNWRGRGERSSEIKSTKPVQSESDERSQLRWSNPKILEWDFGSRWTQTCVELHKKVKTLSYIIMLSLQQKGCKLGDIITFLWGMVD